VSSQNMKIQTFDQWNRGGQECLDSGQCYEKEKLGSN